jgi:hypothetical protein
LSSEAAVALALVTPQLEMTPEGGAPSLTVVGAYEDTVQADETGAPP